MGYPDYPNNRLIVNGVDLTETYRMVLIDGYTLEPPEPKTYYVDIPGGNGKIDLSEALTDEPVYENRNQEFNFVIVNASEFEKTKTEVANFLHGKSFDYKITMDPDYTYHGRFTVSEYTHSSYADGIVGAITIKIDAEPYKTKGLITDWYNITDGAQISILSGRKRVRPKFEFNATTYLYWGGKQYTIPKGTYTLDDVVFSEGANRVTLVPVSMRKYMTYKEMALTTYEQLGSEKRIYEWYRGVDKWMVSKVSWTGIAGVEMTGDFIITATFENGDTDVRTIHIDQTITANENGYDYVWVKDDGTNLDDSCGVRISTGDYDVFYGIKEAYLPFSNVSPVETVVVRNGARIVTCDWETIDVRNTSTHGGANWKQISYGDYAQGGSREMTYGDMASSRFTALTSYLDSYDGETTTDALQDSAVFQVWIEHEWSDL